MNHPYIANTEADRRQMLASIGVNDFDQLVGSIPKQHYRPQIDIPKALSEQELVAHLAELAGRNATPGDHPCFMGGVAEWHYIPAAIGALVSRGEFLTAYTPYQAEASQGTLQVGFEFQTAVTELLGMDVANSGMYDGATAFAEACLMACRLTKRSKVAVLDSTDPNLSAVLKTYTRWQGINLLTVSGVDQLDDQTACIALQSPDRHGTLSEVENMGNAAHEVGALCVVHTHPLACALFKPPGQQGADIVTAEGQPLGVPLSFGGAYVGLFTCRQRHIRQMPGRLVGATKDSKGRRGFVLTLQTREQHIRRQKATSNICTSTQLGALMVTVYLALMGSQGLRQIAELCYHKAHWAWQQVGALENYAVVPRLGDDQKRFFNQFAVRCPLPAKEINRRLFDEYGIIGGTPLTGDDNTLLLALTEMNTKDSIGRLVNALQELGA